MAELSHILGQIIMDEGADPPSRFGPINSPVDRFAHLPEGTRKWIEGLREEDIEEITEAVRFMRSARTVGRFGKWFIITTTTLFVGTVALGEKIGVAWKWFSGGK